MKFYLLIFYILFSVSVKAHVLQCLNLFEYQEKYESMQKTFAGVSNVAAKAQQTDVFTQAQELSLLIEQFAQVNKSAKSSKHQAQIQRKYLSYQKQIVEWMKTQNIMTKWVDIPFYRHEGLSIAGFKFQTLVVEPQADGVYLSRAAYDFANNYEVLIAVDPLAILFTGGRAAYNGQYKVLYLNKDYFDLSKRNLALANQLFEHEQIHMYLDVARKNISQENLIAQMQNWPIHAKMIYSEGGFTRAFSFEELLAHGYNVQSLVKLYHSVSDVNLRKEILIEINAHKKLLLDYLSSSQNFLDQILNRFSKVSIEESSDLFSVVVRIDFMTIKLFKPFGKQTVNKNNMRRQVNEYLKSMSEFLQMINEVLPQGNLNEEQLKRSFFELSTFHDQQIIFLKKHTAPQVN